MFKRILAAIDVSEDSTKAAEVAIELARTYGSRPNVANATWPANPKSVAREL
jgi:hypothetical protein